MSDRGFLRALIGAFMPGELERIAEADAEYIIEEPVEYPLDVVELPVADPTETLVQLKEGIYWPKFRGEGCSGRIEGGAIQCRCPDCKEWFAVRKATGAGYIARCENCFDGAEDSFNRTGYGNSLCEAAEEFWA